MYAERATPSSIFFPVVAVDVRRHGARGVVAITDDPPTRRIDHSIHHSSAASSMAGFFVGAALYSACARATRPREASVIRLAGDFG
jgi:hypothetical protein